MMATVIGAKPARLRNNRFFARQQAEDGLYGAPSPPEKQGGEGYHYAKPENGLPSEPPITSAPEEIDEPDTEPTVVYLPPPENEPTEEVEAEAVAGGDENDVENSQADQLRQYKQARRLVRPLKLVDGRKPQKFQRLVYYPVSARLQSAQPVLAAAAVPVAYVAPENGFAYSTQVFHQQQW